MPDTIMISVVMPVFNHAPLFRRALEALLAQTVAPGEIIIIDDASTDASVETAEQFRSRFEPSTRLTILRNPLNLGVNASLNRGLGEVTGSHVCCTAADDWLEPRYMERMGAAAAEFPEARIITSPYVEHVEAQNLTRIHDARSEMGIWYARQDPAFLSPDEFSGLLRRGHIAIPVSASLIRTDALRQIGGFDPALKWHADWFVAYALALKYGLGVVSEPLAVFRIASGTFSGDNVRHVARQREVCNAILDTLARPEYQEFRAGLKKTPAPFAPFVRHMLPALRARAQDRDLFIAAAFWWLNEARKGRRPGALRRLVEGLSINTSPRL
jgi:glycosyltransferase involved in cell wall biosynthesis